MLAIEAGCDARADLRRRSGRRRSRALEALIHAVEEGTLPLERVEDALKRQRRAKERFLAPPPAAAARRRARCATLLGRDEHQADRRRDGAVRLRMRKPRALEPGDRLAIVAPASPFARDEFDAGVAEIRALGFEPVYDESRVRAASAIAAGSAPTRAAAFCARLARSVDRRRSSPCAAATAASQLLPLLDSGVLARAARCSSATATSRRC